MRRWGVYFGRWWMVQYALDGTLSFGVHLDPKRRVADEGTFGPYLEIHFLCFAFSIGNNPAGAWNYTLIRPLWSAS